MSGALNNWQLPLRMRNDFNEIQKNNVLRITTIKLVFKAFTHSVPFPSRISVFMCQLKHKRITYLGWWWRRKDCRPQSKILEVWINHSRDLVIDHLQLHLNMSRFVVHTFPHSQSTNNMIILNYMLWWQKAKNYKRNPFDELLL